jgi:sugar lactone lactonase YvrE
LETDMKIWIAFAFALGCSHAEPRPAPTAATYDLPGDGNGAYWDADEHALYLTDDTHAQIVRWTEARGFEPAGSFTPGAQGLGGLVRTRDGAFVVTSFGMGKQGGVLVLSASGATAVANLDVTRRRIGITRAPDGTLYDAYFVVEPDKKHVGGVAKLDTAGGKEEPLTIPGLEKAVGVAATATTLYVSDQEQRAILAYDLASAAVTVAAKDLPSVDMLALLPNGDLVTGGKRGEVYRIDPHGGTKTIASGFSQVRGVAYDAAGARLFVVEHGANGHHVLHVLPLAN